MVIINNWKDVFLSWRSYYDFSCLIWAHTWKNNHNVNQVINFFNCPASLSHKMVLSVFTRAHSPSARTKICFIDWSNIIWLDFYNSPFVYPFLHNLIYHMFMMKHGKCINVHTTYLNYSDILHFTGYFSILETDVHLKEQWKWLVVNSL